MEDFYNKFSPILVHSPKINGVELAGTNGFLLGIGQSKALSGNVVNSSDCSAGDTYSLSVSGNYTDMKTSATYLFNQGGFKLEGICAA